MVSSLCVWWEDLVERWRILPEDVAVARAVREDGEEWGGRDTGRLAYRAGSGRTSKTPRV